MYTLNNLYLVIQVENKKITELVSDEGKSMQDYQEQIQELNTVLAKDGIGFSLPGIMFSKAMDYYYYMHEIYQTPGDKTYYLVSYFPLTDSIAFYFKRRIVNHKISQIFGDHPKIFLGEETISYLDEWKQFFDEIGEETINIHTLDFNDDIFEFLANTFQQNIAHLFFALLLEIPVVISNLKNDEVLMYEKVFYSFVPGLIIRDSLEMNQPMAHVFLLSDAYTTDNFQEVFAFDQKTGEIQTNFKEEIPDHLLNMVEEGLMLQEEGLIPFHKTVYMKLFWTIQKVFAVLAIENGETIDFANYLYDEEIAMKPILSRIFKKIVLLREILIV